MENENNLEQPKPMPAPERIPIEYEQAFAEWRYCKLCRRAFKSVAIKRQHDGFKHVAPAGADTPAPTPEPAAKSSALPPGSVLFLSPRAHSMRMILPNHASTWQTIDSPTGKMVIQTQGVEIQFERGQFITDDPRIIAYLEGDIETCRKLHVTDRGRPVVYKDDRFPILSQRNLREKALTY